MNNKTEEEYWLALARAPGMGSANFARLMKHFENPRAVFKADILEWQDLKLKEKLIDYLREPDWHKVEEDMQWLTQPNHHLVTFDHPDYPPLLREINNPPFILFVKGDYTLLSSRQLAIVGTRHPTSEAEQTAKEFAEYLSNQGFTITSGMALGIDGASHWGALAGSGKTIAVAGTGLDRVYPAKHRELAYKIAESGALVSELPLGTQVKRHHFPIRSRIVSGLSLGTLIIEAPEKSGALYTASHAQKQRRELFAIPGSIYNPLVKGNHQLIKKGAKLVEKAADIIEELPNISNFTNQNQIEKPIPTASTTVQYDYPINSPTTDSVEPSPNLSQLNNQNQIEKPIPTASKTVQYEYPVNSPTTESVEHLSNQNQIKKPAASTTVQADYIVKSPPTQISDLDNEHARLLGYLQAGPTSIDNLVEQSGLTAGEISSMLLILELRGLVTEQAGGLYVRT